MRPKDESSNSRTSDPDQLRLLVLESLKSRLQTFSLDITEVGIVLNGCCDSYYAKQMVQEIVAHRTHFKIAANNLVVTYPPPYKSLDDHLPITPPKKRLDKLMNHEASFSKVFFPTDGSSDSEGAFVHALKIALQCKAVLQMMRVDGNGQADSDDLPNIPQTLERWRALAEKRLDATGNELDMGYSRIRASSTDPIKSCLDHLEAEDVDLIVLAVRQREGMMRWLGKMVGERISEGSKQPTLFLPTGRSGFVSAANGSVTLKNILIPIVKKPRAEPSVAFVRKLIRSLDVVTGSVSLLHVGTSETMPFVQYPMSNGWTWNRIRLEGERTETIVQFAKDIDANLIVMTTDGPDRFLDGLRGTTSERVLRKAHCPVAVLPVESVIE